MPELEKQSARKHYKQLGKKKTKQRRTEEKFGKAYFESFEIGAMMFFDLGCCLSILIDRLQRFILVWSEDLF